MVEYLIMVHRVIRSIPPGEPKEILLNPASALQIVKQRPWYVLYCLLDGASKRSLAANHEE